MTTGITIPGWSLVLALNSLQKAMMLTPCWPSAGPTGGAGFAAPAGICSLICPVIFFAMVGEGRGVVEGWSDASRTDSTAPTLHHSVCVFIILSRLANIPIQQAYFVQKC